MEYLETVIFFKKLRKILLEKYPLDYYVGTVYHGNISFLPFVSNTLRSLKLKTLIVYNHQNQRFEIWLAAQNKQIQRQYWEIFKNSDWEIFQVPESIDGRFNIVELIVSEAENVKYQSLKLDKLAEAAIRFNNEIEKIFNEDCI